MEKILIVIELKNHPVADSQSRPLKAAVQLFRSAE
jgi:hypothetical protein